MIREIIRWIDNPGGVNRSDVTPLQIRYSHSNDAGFPASILPRLMKIPERFNSY